jgi:hypothetical protein
MSNNFHSLAQLLALNDNIIAAWFDPQTEPATLRVMLSRTNRQIPTKIPVELQDIPLQIHTSEPIKPLIIYNTATDARHPNQACQNEPIDLGTQIQPSLANWLGTAGAPVKWLDANEKPHWGILSNWHVMAAGHEKIDRPQHQPTTAGGAIARLSKWSGPKPDKQNLIDAAVADALMGKLHTISPKILRIGEPHPTPISASLGLAVVKSGRTTGVTAATCIATGAAVRVQYDDFQASFVDQDIYQNKQAPFSAPGDSGSLILGRDGLRPCSLLFAGSAQITVGNPIRHVVDAFNLVFPFLN